MHIQFAELPVTDQDRAKAFYIDMLGCELVADTPIGANGWRWIEVRFPGTETALHMVRQRPATVPEEPVLVFVDPDVAGVIERLRTKGVEIITEPFEAPWQPGRVVAEFRDSEGNRMVVGS